MHFTRHKPYITQPLFLTTHSMNNIDHSTVMAKQDFEDYLRNNTIKWRKISSTITSIAKKYTPNETYDILEYAKENLLFALQPPHPLFHQKNTPISYIQANITRHIRLHLFEMLHSYLKHPPKYPKRG